MELWDAPILDSARKHGISDESIRHALRFSIAQVHDPEDDDVDLFLGPDHAANLIEVGVLTTDIDGPVIIHAMPGRMRRFHQERQ